MLSYRDRHLGRAAFLSSGRCRAKAKICGAGKQHKKVNFANVNSSKIGICSLGPVSVSQSASGRLFRAILQAPAGQGEAVFGAGRSRETCFPREDGLSSIHVSSLLHLANFPPPLSPSSPPSLLSPPSPPLMLRLILMLMSLSLSLSLSLLQMIIQRILPLANDHPEDLASCK